jgi:DNA-binding transcriptional regulator YiaG
MTEKQQQTKPNCDKERILALRRHLGLTQQALAAELGTRQQTISEWEKGLYQPRGASARLLSLIAERSNFTYNAGQSEKNRTEDGA